MADRLKVERKKDRERKEKIKTRSDYMKEAQIEFNKYIRSRDEGKPCISCGTPLVSGVHGGGFDSGHFRSRGSAPHLAFDERNAHGQCKRCNRYLSGNISKYRIGLVGRIGADRVVELESDNEPKHYTKEDLINIRDTYRAKTRELKKLMSE